MLLTFRINSWKEIERKIVFHVYIENIPDFYVSYHLQSITHNECNLIMTKQFII